MNATTPAEPVELTWDQFVDEFAPIRHPDGADVGQDGCLLETYGSELALVKARMETHPGTVWTYLDDGEGGTLIGDGYSHVNRLGYLITERPAKEGVTYVVDHCKVEPEEDDEMEDQPQATKSPKPI